jgi:hypothetical protein
MKKAQLKELIKQSMTELNSPEYLELMKKADDTGRGYAERDKFRNQAYDLKRGAMTPDEERMVSDYEEEKANSDVLISDNPLEENTGDMPEDIEWMWDGEVYDRIDYHSGDIGLEGYSPSTGRNYTASVMADYNGDDWDWSNSNIENIEVATVKENKNNSRNLRERKEPLSKLIRKADRIVEAWTSKKLIKEADLSQANFDDLTQVVKNIAHINEVGMEEAAMQAIEYIAEQFDVPVDFKDFD